MYQKMMIPLDGSELAECVLPCVEGFFKDGMVKEAVFITAVESQPITLYDDAVILDMVKSTEPTVCDLFSPNLAYCEKERAERKVSAKAYLDRITHRFNNYRVGVECEVIEGQVTETLAGYAEDNKVDLIVIATHGRSGIGRWLMGSVAERLLRSSHVPVLMVKATGIAVAEAA